MQVKRIRCPQCRVVLEVKNTKGEAVKQIICPSCKTALQVKFDTPMEARTYHIPPRQSAPDNGETQLPQGLNGATQLVPTKSASSHHLHLAYNVHTYPLAEGQNIIGRKGYTSEATVQIDTDDRYMSRLHCIITVTTLPDGTRKAVLSNHQNKNTITVDGQPLEAGDAIRLADGNSIRMGHTDIIFKLT